MASIAPEERRGAETERVLLDLLVLERELSELEYVRRTDALERAADAIRRLGEVAPTEGILTRAAAELGTASEFHRVVISEVVDGRIVALAMWASGDPEAGAATVAQLARTPVKLEYPLVEYEVARRHETEIVDVAAAGARTPGPWAHGLRWSAYAVAPLTVSGETIGFLHADAGAGGRAVDAVDADVASRYAEGLSGVLERAVLRHTLELHRAQLSSAVQWMSVRLSRLEDATGRVGPRPAGGAGPQPLHALTPRELEVMRLLARGNTNLEIARTLVVREGTVKYHVKNILRKLGATSRADAVARFVRAGG